jgi:FkbM family methyltransferase
MIKDLWIAKKSYEIILKLIDKVVREPNDFSQSRESAILFKILENYPEKIIIDVGSNDGKTFSNSYYFICKGWKAILLEPAIKPYAKSKLLHQNMETVEIYNAAASNVNGKARFFTDINGHEGSNLFSTLQADRNWFSENWVNLNSSFEVETLKIGNLLEERKIPREFALLSIDTEGHDLQVLQGMGDFRPAIIISERHITKYSLALMKQELLVELGYLLAGRIGCNEIYIDTKSTYLKNRIQTMELL